MRINQQHIEKLARVAVAKPLAWSIYVCGVTLILLARVSVMGAKWLIWKWKGVRWAK